MLLAWYAAVRHDLMTAPEGRGGHGPAASGPVLDDVRSGAGMGGAALQISLPDRARDRGRAARLRAAAAAASVRPAVPARARIAADTLPGGLAHVLARVQGEHPPDRADVRLELVPGREQGRLVEYRRQYEHEQELRVELKLRQPRHEAEQRAPD